MHHLLTAKAAATGTAIFMGGLGFENLLLNKTSRAYYFMRGSKPESSGENLMPVEHRHSHHSSRRHSSSDSHVEPGEKDASFDMYIYSMTYQPEFCRENSSNSFAGCKKPNEEWEGQLTIHGLWPERNDGSWPATCTNEPLDTNLISSDTDLNSKLEEKWPNVKTSESSPSHTEFWAHEWSKHGTCSGLNQHDYFSAALDLLLPTPPLVKSGYGSVVNRDELIKEYGGPSMAIVVCKAGFLSEVRVCFGKEEGGKPADRMECPGVVLNEGTCGEKIKIASFDSSVDSVIKID
mmetsp:Transcript_16046/g.33659  ORF Transcript_16046/g.33659 Transcript_16046/m.33659 type:complete len:292 (-) Transcript_16046:192-1067(-)|eukprot:CAMPEP_0171344202 /NCGR_PEP_ID=MMETSP0878-20121228/18878_1 /TAXON_ID=67004 /ORGANISM="Thalassiosira weissflogii, Strain CCMP1336" /LENGTH=291 /DNA_ID=CAMNT_0011847333 /DNA_START=202 /DNA_END=1077 /DNA_ORIENTATION=-